MTTLGDLLLPTAPDLVRTATPPIDGWTTITPATGWRPVNFRELWNYRELLFFLTWRDVKVRYKQTLLGAAWAVLQPVAMMMVFTVFFGKLARVTTDGVPYPVFVFAGLLPWTFFSNAVASAGNSVVGSERLISKVYFPRLSVPFAAVGAALVDFLIAMGVLLAMMAWYRVTPGTGLLLVPWLVALLLLAGLGVGTLLAALNVSYRDFKYVIPFLLQLWMFATPSVYMPTSVADETGLRQTLLWGNPVAALVAAFRQGMLGGAPNWAWLAASAATVLLLFTLGTLYFRRVEQSFADVI